MQCISVGQSLQLYRLDGGGGVLAAGAPHAGNRALASPPHPAQAEDVRPEGF